MQMAMNSIQEFDGTDRDATIPWLDHIEAISRKTGFNPLEIGMSKLKGMVLCNVSTINKEGNLSYFQFHQLLIEHYSNVLYVLDALNAYAHQTQGKNKTVTQVLWECIHHTSKLCDIPGSSYDNLYLIWGMHLPHVQRRVASKQDTWRSMEDVFKIINWVTRSEKQNRAFFKPNFKTVQPVTQVNEVNYGKTNRHNMLDQSYNGQHHQVWFSKNFRDTNRHPRALFKKGQRQLHYKHGPRKITCYYCEGEHMVKDCIKCAKEKSRDKQKRHRCGQVLQE